MYQNDFNEESHISIMRKQIMEAKSRLTDFCALLRTDEEISDMMYEEYISDFIHTQERLNYFLSTYQTKGHSKTYRETLDVILKSEFQTQMLMHNDYYFIGASKDSNTLRKQLVEFRRKKPINQEVYYESQ